jgi:uncharacterized delta-60 repeat protein
MGKIKIFLLALLLTLSSASSVMALGDGIAIVKVGNGTYASGVEIQKDGKILVSAASFFANQGRSILIRRNADGSPDQFFGHDGMITTGLPDNYIESEGMALQGDGKAVIAGRVIPINEKNEFSGRTNDDFVVIRYTPEGQLDKEFNHSGWVKTDIDGAIDVAYGVAVQKDRKIVVIGNALSRCMVVSSCYHFALLRYNEDGSLDRGFGKRGKAITRVGSASEDSARAIAIQADGRILVAGKAHRRYEGDVAIVRYKPDGTVDRSFGVKGKVRKQFGKDEERIGSAVKSMAIQPDGKIVVGINLYQHGTNWVEGRLMRYNPDGSLDRTFGTGGLTAVNKDVGSVALQEDGKILFCGGAYDESSSSHVIIVGRRNRDGSPDTSFGSHGITRVMMGKSFATGRRIAIQQDGRIVVAGDVGTKATGIHSRSSRYPSDLVLFRLTTNGQLDEKFGSAVR